MATNQLERGPTQRGLGDSDTQLLSDMFPGASNGAFDFKSLDMSSLAKLLTNGVVQGNVIAPSVDLDYDAPEVTEFHIKHNGSPGPGSSNPNDLTPLPNYNPPRSGFGSTESPHNTSAAISGQSFLSLIPGSSS